MRVIHIPDCDVGGKDYIGVFNIHLRKQERNFEFLQNSTHYNGRTMRDTSQSLKVSGFADFMHAIHETEGGFKTILQDIMEVNPR